MSFNNSTYNALNNPMINNANMNQQMGDNIQDLPLNNQSIPKKTDLEMIYNLFNDPVQVPQTNTIVKSTFDNLKLSIVAGILFGIFTLSFTSSLFENYFKNSNPVIVKLITIIIFMVVFFVIQKILKL